MNWISPFMDFLRRSRKLVLHIVMVAMVILVVIFAAQWRHDVRDPLHFPSFGTLSTVNVKAYWDESHLNETKGISWGIVLPGSSYNNTLFLQSISNVATVFELTTGNWTFRNSHGAIALGPVSKTSYMNLTWNHVKRNINPKETVQVTLTLVVTDSSDFVLFVVNNDIKEFSLDIIIRAVESQ